MVRQNQRRFDAYARQRLYRFLLDLQQEKQQMNWSSMAEDIYLARGVKFQRNNFYRLRDGTLGDENIEIIVQWLEDKSDERIRDRLKPQSIFHEVGVASRDYYFHIPAENYVDEWDEQVLEEFSGVYLCAPAEDRNSFIPLPVLRRWFADRSTCPELEKKGRSLDIKQYIQERSILILQRTASSYFYAAEFPLSSLFPSSFVTLDIRMVYEGVGVVSSNAIQVQLRECLSHVPKTHSILISQKTVNQYKNPFDLSIYLPPGAEKVREEWRKIDPSAIDHLKRELAFSIEADHYLAGPSQITVSPLPFLKNKVGMSFAREMVYHRKPADFLREKDRYFIRPDIENTRAIEKILANPLSIGELL